jgi:RHS repeat-associated protein
MTGSTLGVVSDAIAYDAFGAVQSYVAMASGSTVYAETLERDTLGRITKKTESIGGATHVYQYSYHPRGWLKDVITDGATSASYTYDDNGNRLSKSTPSGVEMGTYDAQDRMLSYGSTTYTYTADGDVATKTDASGTTTYSWDGLRHLVKVTRPGGLPLIEYIYDPAGRRIGKKTGGAITSTWLYVSGTGPAAEISAGAVATRFAGHYIVQGGSLYFLVRDTIGSVRAVVDSATGAVVESLSYDEYGNVIVDTAPGFQRLGFGGGLSDGETQLVHFGARDFDPISGRWISKDPLVFRGRDANLFAYADTDPVNKVDPSGLQAIPCPIEIPIPVPFIPHVPDVPSYDGDPSDVGELQGNPQGVQDFLDNVKAIVHFAFPSANSSASDTGSTTSASPYREDDPRCEDILFDCEALCADKPFPEECERQCVQDEAEKLGIDCTYIP